MTNCSMQPTSGARAMTQIVIPPGERLGDMVIEVEGLTKAYGDRC